MKRMFNRKKRPSVGKKGLTNRRIFKTIKKKKEEIEFGSPRNTTQYLIDNGSTPFIEEEDYDLDLDFNPNPILLDKDSENLLDSCCLDLVKNSSFSTQSDISFMTSY